MYSYDRTANAGLNDFFALPKRATAGTSLTPIQITITSSELGYKADFDIYGEVRGDMQSVVDEMRLTMLDIHQVAQRFFSETVLSRYGVRMMDQGRESVTIASGGLHLHTYTTFSLKKSPSPEVLRDLLQQSASFFGSLVQLKELNIQ